MLREQLIIDQIKGREVLDIGSLGQSDKYCLWNFLSEHSAKLTGVDLPQAEETALSSLNVPPTGLQHKDDPRIVFGNMETLDLHETFDAVVAGDVIEHVSNQGMFLDNIRRHLNQDGILIITTPNAKWPTVVLKPNLTHVLWHDIHTLRQLLERHGFSIETFRYYPGNKPHYPFWQRPLLIRQQLFVAARKQHT